MNRYPKAVKPIRHVQPTQDDRRRRNTFLLLLLLVALSLGSWLQGSTAGVFAEENPPVSPITCFLAANIPEEESAPGGILLAWRTAITDTSTFRFELARAQYPAKDSGAPGQLIPESEIPGLQNQEMTENLGEWRYTVLDTRVVSDTKYAYVLTATETISLSVLSVLTETRVFSGAPIPYDNSEICLKGSTVTPQPTETSLPTITPTPTWTSIATDTPLPPTPTHTATPTWTPTPTNTQPPSPIIFPTDTPYPSPTFTPLPTDTPVPPTPTVTPTETPSPTFTPAISAPTPRFDAGQPVDPANSSILPTPDWMLTPEIPIETETPTPTPTESPSPTPEPMIAENAAMPLAEEAIPAQANLLAAENTDSGDAAVQTISALSDTAQVRSEYRSLPTRDGSSILRLALYTVGALAVLSAFAFLAGALALFGGRRR